MRHLVALRNGERLADVGRGVVHVWIVVAVDAMHARSNEEAVWTGGVYVLYGTYTSQSTRPECRKDDRVEERMLHGPTTKASHTRGFAQCGVERVLLPDRGSPSLVTRNRSQEATKRVNEDSVMMLVVGQGEVG